MSVKQHMPSGPANYPARFSTAAKVLVVDDNAAIHEDFRKILKPADIEMDSCEAALFGNGAPVDKQNDFEVDSAFQGQDGLAAVAEAVRIGRPYAVAFVDIRMPPGWDGVETTSQLWQADPDLQVVLCSAFSDYSWEKMIARLGTSDRLIILKKPFENIEVLQLAHVLTEKRALLQRLRRHGAELEATVTLRTQEVIRTHHELMAGVARRKEEAKALQVSEQRLRLAVKAGGLGVFEHTVLDGTVLVSPEFCQIFGLQNQRSIGMELWGKCLHPDDEPRVLAEVQKFISEQTAFDSEYRIKHADGSIRWIRAMATPVVAGGRTERVHGMVQDITQTKHAENQLRKLSRAVEQSPASVIITDLKGDIEYVNPKFCTITGYTAGELIGRNPRILKAGHLPAEVYRQLWETIKAGEEWRGEFYNRKKNGDHYWESASISPIRDHAGNITHFLAVKEDITRRKEIEEAFVEAEENYRALFDRSLDCVFAHDFEGKFLELNPAGCALLGYPLEEVRSLTFGSLIVAGHLPRARAVVEEVLRTGTQAVLQEFTLRRKDGTFVDVESKSSLVLRNGKPYAVQGVARDITQRKRDEAARLESERFLQSTLDSLSAHIAILDEQGVILAVNAAWNEFARKNNFLGSNFGIGINYLQVCETASGECAAEAPALAQGIRIVLAGKSHEFQLEYPCHSPEQQRWFTARVTRFAGDGPVRVVVAHENITGRKIAEEKITAALKYNQLLLHHSPVGVITFRATGEVVSANKAVAEIVGASEEQIHAQNFRRLDSWKKSGLLEAATLALEEDAPKQIEVRHVSSFGKERWINGQFVPFRHEGEPHLLGLFVDLTERKRVEEELLWQTALFRANLDSTLDAVLVVDAHARKIIQNRQLIDLFKVPQEIINDEEDSRLLRHVIEQMRQPQQFAERVKYLYDHREEISREEIELKNGRVLDRYSAPVRDKNGKYYGRLWSFRDITERKRADEALKEQLALRERLTKIAANAPGIIYTFRLRRDGSSCMPYASPTIEEFLGVPA